MGTTENLAELSTVIHSFPQAWSGYSICHQNMWPVMRIRSASSSALISGTPSRTRFRAIFAPVGPTRCRISLSSGRRYPQVAVVCPQLLHNPSPGSKPGCFAPERGTAQAVLHEPPGSPGGFPVEHRTPAGRRSRRCARPGARNARFMERPEVSTGYEQPYVE